MPGCFFFMYVELSPSGSMLVISTFDLFSSAGVIDRWLSDLRGLGLGSCSASVVHHKLTDGRGGLGLGSGSSISVIWVGFGIDSLLFRRCWRLCLY